MLRAASFLEDAKPACLKESIVTALITYPDMFSSELCIFFDPGYFEGFFERNGDDQVLTSLTGKSLQTELGLEIPENFEESGFHCLTTHDGIGKIIFHEEEWWSYRPTNKTNTIIAEPAGVKET